LDTPSIQAIKDARVLGVFGDSITTDHISPAGNIAADSPAGKFLQERGVQTKDFNQYGTRRGNDLVMARGTFANIRLKNVMVAPKEGNWTKHQPDGEVMSIFDAAMKYKEAGVASIVLAGKEYGTGSSRDWAAKGVSLLGVRAVIAQSYERIHRSNLVGMGVLPLQFLPGENVKSLGLTGRETFEIEGWEQLQPNGRMQVRAWTDNGAQRDFEVAVRIVTPAELDAFRQGGILHAHILELLKK
jgi:aconitate hydratase